MRRRQFVKFIGGVALAWPLNAGAQPAGKSYLIGYFNAGAAGSRMERAFVEALRELGWMEGKNIALEYRFAENHSDRLPGMATELVHLKVDVIVENGTLESLAAKQATSTIPIVTAPAGDPVRSGLVPSLARPRGNVTGLSLMAPDLGGKRL